CMMRSPRSAILAAAALAALGHAGLYAGAGWIARVVLAHRTLDGAPQTSEQWLPLLHAMILRSAGVMAAALGVALALATWRPTREALRALSTREAGPLNLAV